MTGMNEPISKSKLKAKMLARFREIEASGEELIVTDHGKPVLKIVPIRQENSIAELFGSLQGQVTYLEDINRSTLEEWEEA
jgi:antitoxin (DNA-binding transcriptional repressor) of toxin-antitoxin stability system